MTPAGTPVPRPGASLPELDDLRADAPLTDLERIVEKLKELAADTTATDETTRAAGALVRQADRLLRRIESSERVAVEEGSLKALRQLLRNEQRRYRDLSDFAHEAYLLTDAEGRIREANRKAVEMLGVEPEELRGRGLASFVPEGRRPEFRERLEDLLSSGGRVSFEMAARLSGRGTVPLAVVAEPVDEAPDGDARTVRWNLRNATDRRRAERARAVLRQFEGERAEAERAARFHNLLSEVSFLLSSSPFRYRAALDSMTDLVVEQGLADYSAVWLREQGRLREAASSFTDGATSRIPGQFRSDYGLAGSEASETLGRIVDEGGVWLLCEDPHGSDARGILPRERADGIVRGVVVPLAAGGAPLGVLGIFDMGVGPGFGDRDADFARQLAERTALGVENARLYREARRALRERDRVQRMASHDLRNGLSTLVLVLDDLRHDVPDDHEWAEHLERADSSLERVIGLVDDLDPSVSADDHRRLHRQTLDLRELLGDVRDAHASAADRKDITLDLEISAEIPEVPVDPQRIRQVLDNIVQNSIKFTPEGGAIEIRALGDTDRVTVSVTDTGPGVPEDDPQRVFARFWRGDAGRSVDGSGLGLSIAKTIVEAHGGRIRARNRETGGTEISFTLPLDRGRVS